MADTEIALFTDGVTANATDRIAAARSPFAAGDDRYLTPAYIATYIKTLTNTWSAQNTFSFNGAASTPPVTLTGTWFTGGSATTTKPQVLIEPTGTTSTGWSTSGTGLGINAASGFAGNLLDLQVNGTQKVSVTAGGQITTPTGPSAGVLYGASALTYARVSGVVSIYANADVAEFNINSLSLLSTASLAWSSGAAGGTADVILARDAANTLAQRNGTTAQKFRLYHTWTDASNGEWAEIFWQGGVFQIQTNYNGTGSFRDFEINAKSVQFFTGATLGGLVNGWNINSSGHFLAGTDNTYDIGAANATRPRDLYLARSFAIEATVTAGGTTGNQTINKAAGTVNFAAAGTTLTVTNSLVTTSSLVFCEVRTGDATASIKNVVPGSGSFVITLAAAATAETSVGFFVVQPD